LNEELIEILKEFIMAMRLALNNYSDEEQTKKIEN